MDKIEKISAAGAKMPEEFQFVLQRMNNNEQTFNIAKTLLQKIVSKMTQNGMGYQTYCNYLSTSKNITVNLLKIYGISEKQIMNAFDKLGYDKNINIMYVDTTYQVLSLAYWIGLEKEDSDIRFLSLALIMARLFNGRLKKYYPNGSNGCNEEIANYILNNKLNNNSKFKEFRSPALLVLNYLTPTMDDKYAKEILKDPTNKKRGLKILMNQGYGRINQMFKTTSNHYYQAYQEGNKESLKSNTHKFDDGNMIETYEGFDNNIDKLSDKITKGLMFKQIDLSPLNKKTLSEKFGINDKVTNAIIKFLHSDDDSEIVKEYYELLLKTLKFEHTEKICNIHVLYTVNELMGTKGRDKNIIRLKDKTDNLVKNIFKIKFTDKHVTQLTKLRKIFIALAVLKMKETLCTKGKDFTLE